MDGAAPYNAAVVARVYVPDLPDSGDAVAVADDEAHHLTRVLRLQTGDVVRAFDGRGREHESRIELAGKGGVILRVGDAAQPAPEPPIAIAVIHAVLKGDGTDQVVRDTTMLGMAGFVPIVTARTETTVARLRQQRRRERWLRVAVASTKQCGRAVVPDIVEPCGFDAAQLSRPAPVFVLVEPRATWPSGAPRRFSDALGTTAPKSATLVVGPEGGWTEEELATAAAAGWVPVTLGGRTLRADAAAVVAMSVLLGAWGDL